jgi:hypothetical protein
VKLRTKVSAVFATAIGTLGFIFGASSGVAALGTAISGAFVFGPIAVILGSWVLRLWIK